MQYNNKCKVIKTLRSVLIMVKKKEQIKVVDKSVEWLKSVIGLTYMTF